MLIRFLMNNHCDLRNQKLLRTIVLVQRNEQHHRKHFSVALKFESEDLRVSPTGSKVKIPVYNRKTKHQKEALLRSNASHACKRLGVMALNEDSKLLSVFQPLKKPEVTYSLQ